MRLSLRFLPGVLALLGPSYVATAQAPCAFGAARSELAANNVRALLLNNGRLFWGATQAGAGTSLYNVPAAPPGLPPLPNAAFSSHLWVGGRVNGEVRMAAGHETGTSELIPGPLDAQGRPDPNCAPYDRIFRLTRADLDLLARGTVSDAVRDWPWRWGAPVIDGDGVPGNYNLAGGDRPELLGSETHWWVMNAMGEHPRTGSAPFPLEVQVSAFAVASAEAALDDATLYRYRFVWRGTGTLTDAFVGFLTDADLGFAGDDYVGADSALALAYTYNADDFDEQTGGYGTRPPALGTTFVQLPRVGIHERAYSAQWHRKPFGQPWGTPPAGAGPQAFLNRLLGLSSDGAPHPRCGDAISPQFLACGTTRFTFTGAPETGTGWTMRTPAPLAAPLPPEDSRMLISAGPFTFQQNEPQDVVVAVTWARGTDHLNSVAKLREATQRVRDVWRATGFQGLAEKVLAAPSAAPEPRAPAAGATGQPRRLTFAWTPIPGATAYTIQIYSAASGGLPAIVTDQTQMLHEVYGIPAGEPARWRVRASNRAGDGPWSAWQDFTLGQQALESVRGGFRDFLITRNAAGPVVPVSYGSFAFNGSGMPRAATQNYGNARADRPLPTSQSTITLDPDGDGVADWGWGIWTFGPHVTYDGPPGQGWLNRVTRDGANLKEMAGQAFEWRFTGSSLAGRPFGDAGPAYVSVPFELWSIGTRLNDPGDDVRMIPLLCEAACGAGGANAQGFDFGGDSPLSGGSDDPISDAVYWHWPADRTPGQAGYVAWAAAAQAGGAGAAARLGPEVLAHVTLMGWNMGPATGLRAARPETGTVFRIETAQGVTSAPVPAAPTAGAVAPAPLVLYWHEPPDTDRRWIELARDPAFTDVVVRDTAAAGSYALRLPLTAGRTYYWRVRVHAYGAYGADSPWSPVWSFTAGTSTAVAGAEALPDALVLGTPYPHPVSGTATVRLGVPEAGPLRVRLYDGLGREVARLHDGDAPAGWTPLPLDVSGLAPGLYVLRAEADGQAVTRAIMVTR
jgi:hypothetical protein